MSTTKIKATLNNLYELSGRTRANRDGSTVGPFKFGESSVSFKLSVRVSDIDDKTAVLLAAASGPVIVSWTGKALSVKQKDAHSKSSGEALLRAVYAGEITVDSADVADPIPA